MDGHADPEGEGGLALGEVAVADAVGAVGGDAEGGIEPVQGLLAGLKVFLVNRKLGGLIVTEVNWTMLPAASSPLVDGLVAALARQPSSRFEIRTIRS